MTIAGIDLSSHAIDVVLLNDDTDHAIWRRFLLPGATPFERARSLRQTFWTRSEWEDRGVYLIGIEDPYSRGLAAAKALGIAAGAVAALLPRDMPTIQLPPAEWKRLFTGSSSADKLTVQHCAAGLYPDAATWDHNVCDAYAIAWATRKLNNDACAAA